MIVLDASFVIAVLNPGDPHHHQAVSLMSSTREELVIHTLTLAEILVGAARVGREGELRRDLSGLGIRTAQLGPDEPELLARVRVQHGLKMPDSCVLATSIHLSAPLVTFDQKLATEAERLGLLFRN